jgi:UDP-N-acetylmuramyl pentapeptide phosphotransferase/UDP-N-acetylglucosamine-1-phosphate transferase
MELTRNGKVVVVTSLFRMIFGGYLIGNDLYRLNDANSALEVLLIYGVIGLLAALFIVSKRHGRFGLLGLIGLDVLFIGAQFVFTFLSISKLTNPGLHDPVTNWWTLLLMFAFSLVTLIFSLRANRETNLSRTHMRKSPITLETK